MGTAAVCVRKSLESSKIFVIQATRERHEVKRPGYSFERPGLRLFQTSTGAQLLQSNTLGDSLHPILKRIKHQKGGFNIFRRFRLTHLEKSGCPDAMKHFWSVHAPKHVSKRNIKLLENRDFGLESVDTIGLGFELPTGSIGECGVLTGLPRAS
jgi:hypothetical protein